MYLLISTLLVAASLSPSLAHASAPVAKLKLQKDSPGVSIHAEVSGRKNATLDLQNSDTTADLPFATDNKVNKVKLTIDWKTEHTLPSGEAVTAHINATIKLRRNGGYKLSVDPVVLQDQKFSKKQLDCSGMFHVNYIEKLLWVTFKTFDGLADCKGKAETDNNPNDIGKRDVGKSGLLSGNYYSSSQDQEVGQNVSDSYSASHPSDILPPDHPTHRYVQNIMDRIAAAADPSDFQPHVFIVNSNLVNAYSLPGGNTYVYRGLIDSAQNEAQLAGVLAHEWAHVVTRTGTTNMSKFVRAQLAANFIAELIAILSQNSKNQTVKDLAPLVETAISYGGPLLMLGMFNKHSESEADRLGAEYGWNAGYSPDGMGQMFQITDQQVATGQYSSFQSYFSGGNHPKTEDRMKQNFELANFFFPQKPKYVVNTKEFDEAKAHLSKLDSPNASTTESTARDFGDQLHTTVKSSIQEMYQSRAGN